MLTALRYISYVFCIAICNTLYILYICIHSIFNIYKPLDLFLTFSNCILQFLSSAPFFYWLLSLLSKSLEDPQTLVKIPCLSLIYFCGILLHFTNNFLLNTLSLFPSVSISQRLLSGYGQLRGQPPHDHGRRAQFQCICPTEPWAHPSPIRHASWWGHRSLHRDPETKPTSCPEPPHHQGAPA